MATDINLSQLVINKLTKAQYKAAKDSGSIVETEMYMVIDENESGDERIATSATLSSSKWSNLSQSVSVGSVTTNSIVIVTPAPNSHEAYGEYGIYCSAQANGTLTFKCSAVPSVNLTVNILILN